jgi:hypothetical protein
MAAASSASFFAVLSLIGIFGRRTHSALVGLPGRSPWLGVKRGPAADVWQFPNDFGPPRVARIHHGFSPLAFSSGSSIS